MSQFQFVLASQSPRRVDLLRSLGYVFAQRPAHIDEAAQPGEAAEPLVRRLARDKAAAVDDGALPVLAADTVVVHDGVVLGKPADRGEAIDMLARLSDSWHEVLTAVSVRADGREQGVMTRTRVRFGPVTAAMAAAYWDSGEPADKAGAYAVQGVGGVFVRELSGSYSGVVGLPLHESRALLLAVGVHAPVLGGMAA